jgi:DNA-directed RNA polymerase specialized sigma24 family protein
VLADLRRERARLETELDASTLPARDAADRLAEGEQLERALAPLERDIVLRFHGRGDSVREIARALHMPEGTVKSHQHRSRRKLAGLGGDA